MRNAIAVLLLSRGTPMLLSGDEFQNSQNGNNNAYCQDNETSWLNWEDLEAHRDFHNYVQALLSFRRSHPIIRRRNGDCSLGFPEIQILEPSESSKVLGIMYAGKAEAENACSSVDETSANTALADDVIVLAVNVYWEAQTFRLPEVPADMCFQVVVNTDLAEDLLTGNDSFPEDALSKTGGGKRAKEDVKIAPRSVQVFRMIPRREESPPSFSS